ncbi:MAG: methyltransferase domain-containing protein [Desulfobacterales bacterium]|nr:methyltransferase domain-containing protein [Desulfobacterales bacterium]
MGTSRLNRIVSNYTDHPVPYLRSLAQSHALREDLLAELFHYLDLPAGSRGMDLGCGCGLPACELALSRPDLRILGVDISADLITAARDIAAAAGAEIRFKTGSAMDAMAEAQNMDWLLSIDCAGYIPELSGNALAGLSRHLKPGGTIALMAWSSQQLLPGYPMLEARLNTTPEGIAPFTPDMQPEHHFLNTTRALSKAGFTNVTAKAFTRTLTGPLSEAEEKAVLDLIRMRWGNAYRRDSDVALFKALTDPESPDYLLGLPTYYGHFTYTLFTAKSASQ